MESKEIVWVESLKHSCQMIIATHRMVGTMLEDVVWAEIELDKVLDNINPTHSVDDSANRNYLLQVELLTLIMKNHFDIEVDEDDFKPFEESFEVKNAGM